jgi:uncharacterized protein YjiS (DUF1127 family)
VSLIASGTGFMASLNKIAIRAVDALLTWQQRSHERANLQSLSDHLLKDVGLNRSDVAREARKPFWRD